MEQIILFGAGSAGRYALKYLRSQGVEPVCFADNDERKWLTGIDGVGVTAPVLIKGMYPDATCVATAISRPAATEIRAQLKAMGVKTKPLWECLDVCHGVPSPDARWSLLSLMEHDTETSSVFHDQLMFRRNPDYDAQESPSDCKDIYFPDFIQHRDDEHFVDCGAADGDTVREFRKRWAQWSIITAIEPDKDNWEKLRASCADSEWIDCALAAVSEYSCIRSFTPTGDYSAHLGSDGSGHHVMTHSLDAMHLRIPPTYIKMDIEGSELEAIWGARRILKEHSPVLAICAYHTSDHLWQIPLLIHAIQPDYKLFLRRYAEGAFELVWYAVPPGRVK